MFTPERMAEVNFFIYEESIQPVVVALAQAGALQIEAESSAPEGAHQNRWMSTAVAYAAQERRLRELIEALALAPAAAAPLADIDLAGDQERIAAFLEEVEPTVEVWRRGRAEASQGLERLHFLIEQMRLLAPLDVPVERLANMQSLHLVVGTMPTANLARIQTALFRIPFVIIPAHTHAAATLVFAATPKEFAPILDRALRSAFFQPIALPADVTGPPAQALAALERQHADTEQRLQDLQAQGRQLASRWGEQVLSAWSRVQACRTLAEAIHHLPVHGQVYVVAGWVPARRLADTIQNVQTLTSGRAIIEVLEPDARRPQVPTLLRNPALLRGFESLVTNFGVPAYHELDPTPMVAVSFLIMYGVMFGDVGHGLLLALAGLWLTRRRGGSAGLGLVLVLAGISAMIFGVLYGTFLGMPLFPPLWLRPAEEITTILVVSLIGGVILLNVGFGLFLITHWRTRNWPSLLFDINGLAGLALYWALLGGGLAVWRGLFSGAVWALLVLLPAAVLFLREPLKRWLVEGQLRPHEPWGEYAVLAFFELFEAMLSFAGNTLSFVRLGAFAVAHEALSHVVLLIAGLSGSLGWLVIIIGTLFVVGFEGLIVGIQTLRLEYYEFFGRFFRGDGRAFRPLQMPKSGRA